MSRLKFPPTLYLYLAMAFTFCGQGTIGIACIVLYLTNRRTAKPKRRPRR